jgi:L-phenylalanine/L-methionine N-acetyltransferase
MTKAQTSSILIRAAEPADASAMSALIGSEGVFEGTLQMPLAAVASRVERYSKVSPAGLLLVAVASSKGAEEVIGIVGLHEAHSSLRRAHVRGLFITVAKPWQGQGVGQRLLTAALAWADNWTGILRIELTVFAHNEKAIALYERHGFAREGVMRAFALNEGAYVDALAMARLHPNPPKLP